MNQIMGSELIRAIKRSFLSNPFMIFVFAFLLQATSSTITNDHDTLVQSQRYFHLSASLKLKMQTLKNEMNELSVLLQPNHEYRFKRSGVNVPNINTTSEMVQNSINKLYETLSRLNNSKSLYSGDTAGIAALETSVNNFQASLETQRVELQQNKKNVIDKMQNFVQSLNNLQGELEVLQKSIDRKELEEAKRRLPSDIVSDIKSRRFSNASQKLQQTDNGTYKYIVHEVYNNQVGNFNLLLDLGNFTSDIESKLKIYDALYHEMKDNSHHDISKLVLLHKSIENEMLHPEGGVRDVESLRLTLRNVIEEKAVNPITASIINYGPAFELDSGGCFPCMIDIYQQVARKLWDKLSFDDILVRTRSRLATLDARVANEIAMFYELQHKKQLYTNKALALARDMKLFSIAHSDYNFLSSEIRSQHEVIKNKFPLSVKNLVFSPIVCIKNTAYNEYLYASVDSKDHQRRRVFSHTHTGFPKPSSYKWEVRFVVYDQIRILNSYYDEYLFGEFGEQPIGPYDDERKYVFTWIPGSHNHKNDDPNGTWDRWNIEVDDDGIYLENQYEKEYLFVDYLTKFNKDKGEVFTYRSGIKPYNSKWEIIEC